MTMSPTGIALLKSFEGLRLKAYNDGVGVITIGYGTTRLPSGEPVQVGMEINQSAADDFLKHDLQIFEQEVTRDTMDPSLGEGRTPTQNQFDAMVCLCYNIGPGNFRQSSVLRRFLQGNFIYAGEAFLLWNKAGGKILPGLTRRREAERDLFLRGALPALPAPPAIQST